MKLQRLLGYGGELSYVLLKVLDKITYIAVGLFLNYRINSICFKSLSFNYLLLTAFEGWQGGLPIQKTWSSLPKIKCKMGRCLQQQLRFSFCVTSCGTLFTKKTGILCPSVYKSRIVFYCSIEKPMPDNLIIFHPHTVNLALPLSVYPTSYSRSWEILNSNCLCLLLRKMCLQRWSFCNLASCGSDQEKHSWKRYFQRRSHLEKNMTHGRSGDYTCKSLRGHSGMRSISIHQKYPWVDFEMLLV